MVQKLIKKSVLARLMEVAPCRVTQLCKDQFKAAIVGNRIDAAHPDVIRYMEKVKTTGRKKTYYKNMKDKKSQTMVSVVAQHEGDEPTQIPKAKRGPRPKRDDFTSMSQENFEHPDDNLLRKFGNIPLKTILAKYGTLAGFADLLKSMKSIEDIIEKRLKNNKLGGELISREYVSSHVLGGVKTIMHRLLNDSPKTITARVVSSLKSGSSEEELEVLVRGLISSQIKSMKQKLVKSLGNA